MPNKRKEPLNPLSFTETCNLGEWLARARRDRDKWNYATEITPKVLDALLKLAPLIGINVDNIARSMYKEDYRTI